ncbi:MAG: 50S ribosomal protein L30 [Proteobacteria bacterium]|nr:50S ribosomal protein L30 [Pseudomonadota bacterium]
MANEKTKATLTVVLKKSGIGYNIKQKQTLVGLGLNKINRARTLEDTPCIRGMINKVSHLVEVVEPEAK